MMMSRWLIVALVATVCVASVAAADDQEFRVHKFPGLPKDLKKLEHYAGFLPRASDPENDHLFFWFVPCEDKDAPLTIWINGGPGCTSVFGFLQENGPFQLKDDGSLVTNPYSWHQKTNMLYITQPVWTGFAYADNPATVVVNEREVSAAMYTTIQYFMKSFPDMAGKPISFFGESYAGHYTPSVAHYIHMKNKVLAAGQQDSDEKKKGFVHVNLDGVALGNGWVDPIIQARSLIDFSFGHGLIDYQLRDTMYARYKLCAARLIASPGVLGAAAMDDCNLDSMILNTTGLPNVFDIRKYGQYSFLLHSSENTLMNSPGVLRALNVEANTRTWVPCNDSVDASMHHDKPVSVMPYLVDLLNDGMRILIYNGDQDLSCNFLGSQEVAYSLPWVGRAQFAKSLRSVWKVGQDVGGYYNTYKNLAFLVVVQSGHLVPMDQPAHALDLMHRFTRRQSFADQTVQFSPQFLEAGDIRKTLAHELKAAVESRVSPAARHYFESSNGHLHASRDAVLRAYHEVLQHFGAVEDDALSPSMHVASGYGDKDGSLVARKGKAELKKAAKAAGKEWDGVISQLQHALSGVKAGGGSVTTSTLAASQQPSQEQTHALAGQVAAYMEQQFEKMRQHQGHAQQQQQPQWEGYMQRKPAPSSPSARKQHLHAESQAPWVQNFLSRVHHWRRGVLKQSASATNKEDQSSSAGGFDWQKYAGGNGQTGGFDWQKYVGGNGQTGGFDWQKYANGNAGGNGQTGGFDWQKYVPSQGNAGDKAQTSTLNWRMFDQTGDDDATTASQTVAETAAVQTSEAQVAPETAVAAVANEDATTNAAVDTSVPETETPESHVMLFIVVVMVAAACCWAYFSEDSFVEAKAVMRSALRSTQRALGMDQDDAENGMAATPLGSDNHVAYSGSENVRDWY